MAEIDVFIFYTLKFNFKQEFPDFELELLPDDITLVIIMIIQVLCSSLALFVILYVIMLDIIIHFFLWKVPLKFKSRKAT